MFDFDFQRVSEMSMSETAFAVEFYKPSGKWYTTEYFIIDAPDTASMYNVNDKVTEFIEIYDNHRGMSAVVVPGKNSYIQPRRISADERE